MSVRSSSGVVPVDSALDATGSDPAGSGTPGPSGGRGRTIKVEALARIEGEGGLLVRVRNDKVVETKLKIFEPPRLFEAFLRGRHYSEVPDLVARICGICPVAHQLTACQALENAFGVTVTGGLRDLRRLIYCGEWIESHVLHVAFLHAPDFFGFEDVLRMAHTHPEVVARALRLKKLGNEMVRIIGGREVHPVNIRVGGFYKLPTKSQLATLTEELLWACDAAAENIRWTATLDFPAFDRDYDSVALTHPAEYAITEGRVISRSGVNISAQDYERRFVEEQVPHSHALHSLLDGQTTYLTGPLARFQTNHASLSTRCRQEAAAAGLTPDCRNPFRSIVVRAVETLFALEEALRIVQNYELPDRPALEVTPRAASGRDCTEAPRGLLYHHYRLSDHGLVLDARIVPPTAQNLRVMEADLRQYVEQNLSLSRDLLTRRCEQVIRNYDPCVSCATHNLTLDIGSEP
jgi:sulfhydrogenase subunit alpha